MLCKKKKKCGVLSSSSSSSKRSCVLRVAFQHFSCGTPIEVYGSYWSYKKGFLILYIFVLVLIHSITRSNNNLQPRELITNNFLIIINNSLSLVCQHAYTMHKSMDLWFHIRSCHIESRYRLFNVVSPIGKGTSVSIAVIWVRSGGGLW